MQKHEAEAHAEHLRVTTGKPHRAVETPEGFTVESVPAEPDPAAVPHPVGVPAPEPAPKHKPAAQVEKRQEAGLKHEEHRKHH